MSFLDFFRQKKLDEELKQFENKGEIIPNKSVIEKSSGEGIEDFSVSGYSQFGVSGINNFYNQFLNTIITNNINRLNEYRKMAQLPEIADVIEDAVNESLEENEDGKTLEFEIIDPELIKNQNTINTLNDEFEKFFYDTLNINKMIWDLFYSYYVDGKVFYERIINTSKPKDGIVALKKLPSETMDYIIDPKSNKIIAYIQSLNPKNLKPNLTLEEARKDNNIIVFLPEQVGFINYGLYGISKKDILGYLEKARVAYNQLKLLETSVIIYRLVRSPERFVFRIDTGQMPLDRAMAFVEKVKAKMSKKQTFDPTTGRLSNEPEAISVLDNYFMPVNSDGRGSSIETIGGNSAGFTELDDIYYFQKKLYRALKYPISRISARHEGRDSEVIFGGQTFGEISRDEIKWAKFLERQNNKFEKEMTDLFLLHLEFKGLKQQYGLNRTNIMVYLQTPNNYKTQIHQKTQETQFQNYQTLSMDENFSKYYLQKTFLEMSDKDIEENWKGFLKDKAFKDKYLPKEETDGY